METMEMEMETTVTRYVRKSSQRAGSHPGGAPDTEGFLKQFALRGRDPAVADENLYRYCENDPTDATDPSGLADTRTAVYSKAPSIDSEHGLSFTVDFLLRDPQLEGIVFFQMVSIEDVAKNASGKEIGRRKQFTFDISPTSAGGKVQDAHSGNLAGDIKNFEQSGERACTIEETQQRVFIFAGSLTYILNGKTIQWDPSTSPQGQVRSDVTITVEGQEPLHQVVGPLADAWRFQRQNVVVTGQIDVKAIYDLVSKKASYDISAKVFKGTYDVSKLKSSGKDISF